MFHGLNVHEVQAPSPTDSADRLTLSPAARTRKGGQRMWHMKVPSGIALVRPPSPADGTVGAPTSDGSSSAAGDGVAAAEAAGANRGRVDAFTASQVYVRADTQLASLSPHLTTALHRAHFIAHHTLLTSLTRSRSLLSPSSSNHCVPCVRFRRHSDWPRCRRATVRCELVTWLPCGLGMEVCAHRDQAVNRSIVCNRTVVLAKHVPLRHT